MQACPPLNCFAEARSAATFLTSASPSTMTGDLPPSSSVTLARCRAAAAITSLPTRVLPVKKMWLKGSSSSAVATFTSPSNTATSFSSKASRTIFAATRAVAGHRSVSFTMQQLPAAMAAASGPITSPSGKFHGPRIRQTPRASWTIRALSSLLSEGCTSTGFIHSSRCAMLRSMLASTFSTSVMRTSVSGLRVSCLTAAMISSAWAVMEAFSRCSFSLRWAAVEALVSHWCAFCKAKIRWMSVCWDKMLCSILLQAGGGRVQGVDRNHVPPAAGGQAESSGQKGGFFIFPLWRYWRFPEKIGTWDNQGDK